MIKLNYKELNFIHFPNGELSVSKKILENLGSVVDIIWNYESDVEFMILYYLKNLLDENNIKSYLHIRYMPYSRMDRDNVDYGFTLKWVSKFINSLNFAQVIILEPHSDVTMALVNNSATTSVTDIYVNKIISDTSFLEDVKIKLFFPDAGAQKRYGGMFDIESLVGFKHRDFKTGRITSLQVLGSVEQGDTIIIVDDLCSGGRTFLESAKKLKELGASKVLLFVTHCENTIYSGDLLKTDFVDHIYTTDSIFKSYNEQKTDKITVFKL
jgi:ribose-phosphate pyrophosphokinase